MQQGRRWNILCWNVRGLKSEDKQLAIRNSVDISSCDIFCLQETKRPLFDRAFVKHLYPKPKRFDQCAFVPSRGAFGGLLTVWNNSAFTGTVIFNEPFALGV